MIRWKIYLLIISIHAPTRGATLHVRLTHSASLISIHAPTRGATRLNGYSTGKYYYFNPRSHERSDVEEVI